MIPAEFYYGSRSWAIWSFVLLAIGFVLILLFAKRDDGSDK